MGFLRKLFAASIIIVALAGWMAPFGRAWLPVFAQEQTPEPVPQRKKTITIKYTAFEWLLNRWKNNRIACRITIDHEGRPTNHEIGQACSQSVYDAWLATQSCAVSAVPVERKTCEGYYLQLLWSGAAEKEVVIDLPLPTVWLTVEGCQLEPPNNKCKNLPTLILTGEEPLPNEVIIRIQGTINGRPFSCPGAQCAIPLQPTGVQGISIEFWAESSFGDMSKHYTAAVRVLPWGDFMAPEGGSRDEKAYYVDVISSQFREGALTSCSDVWDVFPDIGGPPPWLTTPKTASALESSQGYYYLAGMLIQNGAVDATGCPDAGLQGPGLANNCGVDAARPELAAWQNQFNLEIVDVARSTGIPGQLMKNIFSRESQFWPGLFKTYAEAGLGALTADGADTLLLYNPEFFKEFCPLVLDQDICSQRTYGGMTDTSETEGAYDPYLPLLRGALVAKVDASCEDCPLGIDMTQAKFSIRVFAQTLMANCQQVGQMIVNTTEKPPAQVSSFTDLWKYTLVNYNAGPGCLGDAMEKAWQENEKLNWDLVSSQLTPACQVALQYVEAVTAYPPAPPTPTPKVLIGRPVTSPVAPPQGAAPSPAATQTPILLATPSGPTATSAPSGLVTPTSDATLSAYAYPYPFPGP